MALDDENSADSTEHRDSGPESDSHDDSDSEDDPQKLFPEILACIKLENAPALCTSIRRQHDGLSESDDSVESKILEEPMCGSLNILYHVLFSDGQHWLLKIPSCGTPTHFTEADADALLSEAKTMKLLRRTTSIPVPEVYGFQATANNELGCPFILMEFISGISLYDCWFDKSCSKEELSQRRTRSLQDIAGAMAQLDQFSFDKGGAPVFSDDSSEIEVGPYRYRDHDAMLRKMHQEGGNLLPIYKQAGPWETTISYYTSQLEVERLDKREEVHSIDWDSLQRLLLKFLRWFPEPKDPRKKFVLAHPDFDIQNFIVSQDGSLRAIIDWDGVEIVPRSVGYERYPGWITRDWDRAMYAWDESMDQEAEPEGCCEDSPDTLSQHRSEYMQLLQSALSAQQNRVNSHNLSDENSLASRSISYTANSLYMENLLIAAGSQISTPSIVDRFVDEIAKRLDCDPPDDFDTFSLTEPLIKGELDEERESCLKKGFLALLSPFEVEEVEDQSKPELSTTATTANLSPSEQGSQDVSAS